MRRLICTIFVICFLTGCGSSNEQIGNALILRQRLLGSNGCTFCAEITADYGKEIYQFSVQCSGDKEGNLEFTVLTPDSISGIAGKITETDRNITFDNEVLAFAPLADGQVTPVTAPWVFLKTLRSGYIASCMEGEELTHLQIDDSYLEKALHLDIWLDQGNLPIRAEILWEGRRILSLKIKDFTIL